ncbi:hypothetical protein C8J57DRAFT_1212388 [Mycena rebaudengoi]|nr:hypothetical protein C8J57DRAFT_1212388 [Mycena rebaudengoi]
MSVPPTPSRGRPASSRARHDGLRASALLAGTTGLRAVAVHVHRLTTLTRHTALLHQRGTCTCATAHRRAAPQSPHRQTTFATHGRGAPAPVLRCFRRGRTVMAARGGQAAPQSHASTRVAPVLRYLRGGRTVAATRGAKGRQARASTLITDAEVHGDAHPSRLSAPRAHPRPTYVYRHPPQEEKKNSKGKKQGLKDDACHASRYTDADTSRHSAAAAASAIPTPCKELVHPRQSAVGAPSRKEREEEGPH